MEEYEREAPKICPLKLMATIVAMTGMPYICDEKRCAWWNKDHDCCAVAALVPPEFSEAD